MDWRRAVLVVAALLALGPDGCGAKYRVEVTLRNDWTENIHLYVLDSAGGGGEEGRTGRNRVSPNGASRVVVLEYDDPGSVDLVLRAGRDGLADADTTCVVELPEPELDGDRYNLQVLAVWGPGWVPCSVEVELEN